jgi:hypothetical protein
LEAIKRQAELQSFVTSVGVHNALSKKKVKLFKEESNDRSIDKEKKQEDLKYLKEKFKE